MVRLGVGIWYGNPGEAAWDGHKYVCEDDFTEEEGCLVYTFGVSDDASFEESMASIGNQTNLEFQERVIKLSKFSYRM